MSPIHFLLDSFQERVLHQEKMRQVQYLSDLLEALGEMVSSSALGESKWTAPQRDFLEGDRVVIMDPRGPRGLLGTEWSSWTPVVHGAPGLW